MWKTLIKLTIVNNFTRNKETRKNALSSLQSNHKRETNNEEDMLRQQTIHILFRFMPEKMDSEMVNAPDINQSNIHAKITAVTYCIKLPVNVT